MSEEKRTLGGLLLEMMNEPKVELKFAARDEIRNMFADLQRQNEKLISLLKKITCKEITCSNQICKQECIDAFSEARSVLAEVGENT